MATPPLPDVPCVRVRLDFDDLSSNKSGCRFYLSYTGSAPSGANCATLASDVSSAFSSNFAGEMSQNFALVEVDVLDITTYSGLSGQWTGTINGGQTGTPLPLQVATNIEFGISRRYRGGKPRIYLPPSDSSNTVDAAHWTSAYTAAQTTNAANFFAALEALSIGSMGTLQHVNLSYYDGYNLVPGRDGSTVLKPKYRGTALHDNITGYFCKATMGSQKRRRMSMTF